MSAITFSVVTVQRSDPPDGADRGTWYRYEIASQRSRITGCRCGSRDQVLRHAQAYAEELNARAQRGYSVGAPRARK
jgi:hypothetical protein